MSLGLPSSALLQARQAAALALLVLPWVWPFTAGPSAAVVPLLAAWACAGVLLMALDRADFARQSARAWWWAALLSSGIALLQNADLVSYLVPWVNPAHPGEVYANLRQRNQFATLTNIGLAAALFLAPSASPRQLAAMLAGAALLAAGNVVSSSRVGLVELLLLCALAWLLRGSPGAQQRRKILLVAVCTYAAGNVLMLWLAGGLGAVGRMDTPVDCHSRLTLWSNVLHLIAQRPWAGWGWGELDYAHYATLYPGNRFCEILDNAHNLPLHLAVELGVPIAVLVCGAIAWKVWRARPWRESDPRRQLAWAVLALMGVHSLLEYPLWYGPFQIAAGVCILLLWPRRTARQHPQSAAPAAALRAGAAAVVLASVAYVAWDYARVSQIYLPPDNRWTFWRDDAMGAARRSTFFVSQARFAELTITPLTRQNAEWTLSTAEAMLHYSPEPKVIEKAIEAATMLGNEDLARAHRVRYQAAFPRAYAPWFRRLAAT